MFEFSNSVLSFLAKSTAPGVSPCRHIVSASYVIVLPSIASTFPSVIILMLLSTTSSTSCITEPGFDLETSVPSGSTALSANTSFPILSPLLIAVSAHFDPDNTTNISSGSTCKTASHIALAVSSLTNA